MSVECLECLSGELPRHFRHFNAPSLRQWHEIYSEFPLPLHPCGSLVAALRRPSAVLAVGGVILTLCSVLLANMVHISTLAMGVAYPERRKGGLVMTNFLFHRPTLLGHRRRENRASGA